MLPPKDVPIVGHQVISFGNGPAHDQLTGGGKRWTTDSIRPIALQTIALFGPQRSMFASNSPVDGLMGSYAGIWGSFGEITRDFCGISQSDAACFTIPRPGCTGSEQRRALSLLNTTSDSIHSAVRRG